MITCDPDPGDLHGTGEDTRAFDEDPRAGIATYALRRLLAVPRQLAAAERVLLARQAELTHAKERLEDARARLLLGETINGRNTETRDAQIRQATAAERICVLASQDAAAAAARDVRLLRDEFAALRSISRILASHEGDDGNA